MIVVGILGDIGSGKTFVSKQFRYPVFDADSEVNKIYKKNKDCFKKLKKKFPSHIRSFPIDKIELTEAILSNKNNLRKIVSVVHPLVRKKMSIFLKRNVKKKMVILDVPLLIENNLDKKEYILIFIDAKKNLINSKLKNRKNYNKKVVENFRKIQKTLSYKKKLSTYIIKNDFKLLTIKKRVKLIKNRILNERNNS